MFPTETGTVETWEMITFLKRIILLLMSYFDTNARKMEILEHLEVGIQRLFCWVWENSSSLCNPSHGEK